MASIIRDPKDSKQLFNHSLQGLINIQTSTFPWKKLICCRKVAISESIKCSSHVTNPRTRVCNYVKWVKRYPYFYFRPRLLCNIRPYIVPSKRFSASLSTRPYIRTAVPESQVLWRVRCKKEQHFCKLLGCFVNNWGLCSVCFGRF